MIWVTSRLQNPKSKWQRVNIYQKIILKERFILLTIITQSVIIIVYMINGFSDKATKDLFNRKFVRHLSPAIQRLAC